MPLRCTFTLHPQQPIVTWTDHSLRAYLQWVTSKEALGLASSTKRPTSCVMVAKIGMKKKLKDGETEKEGLAELEAEFVGLYAEMVKEVEELVSC